MILRSLTVIAFLVAGAHSVSAMTSPGADTLEAEDARGTEAPAAPSMPAAQVVVNPAAPAPMAERTLSANPLWAIPFSALSGTRDRPIFSQSRRPPVPAVAPFTPPKLAVAPKPREPERPQFTLVGTVSGDDEGFGIFLDQSTRAALRLKVGEDYQGWKLRAVQGREAILAKDQEVVILALPQPGSRQSAADSRDGKPPSVTPTPRTERRDR